MNTLPQKFLILSINKKVQAILHTSQACNYFDKAERGCNTYKSKRSKHLNIRV